MKKITLKLACEVIEEDSQKNSIKQTQKAIDAIGEIQYEWLHDEAWRALQLLRESLVKIKNGNKS